ncbi:helix-turn-helix transcriptional regulator [Morganella morganii]|uniref:helix-turn-helix domain-containing protein n=1 Tax=Morganella morganii TaxID=582 RepID=UPI000662963E|nr:helix-turn-helix transcriptional regulator [Morganella morganii]EMD0829197.1 helix-turn-helix transcriptional regulator [Morganella morganii]
MLEISLAAGRKIRKIRRESGFSTSQLSILTGIPQQKLLRFERGESRLHVDTLYQLCLFFDYDISVFFDDIYKELDFFHLQMSASPKMEQL